MAAVAVEGGDADQGRDLASVDLAQFGQLGEQGARELRSDAGHALQELVLRAPVGTVLDAGLQFGLKSLAFLLEPGDVRLDAGAQGGSGGAQALALGDQHREQLPAPGEQLTQVPGLGVGQRTQRHWDGLGEVGQDGGVERVGLGQPAAGAGEVAHLARAKSRTWRGLTSATGNPAAASAATSGCSRPPVASSTIRAGPSASSRVTRASIPAASLATRWAGPSAGRMPTSNHCCDTSIPT